MRVIKYSSRSHGEVIKECVAALRGGKIVAYPTETSYGLACDASNEAAVQLLYQIKGRDFKKPVHVLVSSSGMAKRIVTWTPRAGRLAAAFWPGPLNIVLPLKEARMKRLSAGTESLGVRQSSHPVAHDLVRGLRVPITATSANRSGQPDCYSAAAVLQQFAGRKFQPDIVIDAGSLPRRRPSTVVKIDGDEVVVLRRGAIIITQ